MTTKRDIITAALNDIGIASYAFDVRAEQWQAALGQLDRMMTAWAAQGIPLRYIQGATTLDDDVKAPDWAHEAMALNLALRLGPSYGRGVSPDTRAAAMQALNAVRARALVVQEIVIDNTAVPAGAGNRWRGQFTPVLVDESGGLAIADGLTLDIGPQR